eukprot:11768104-Alexandrium_andersonii.AAC.1
MGLIGVVRYFWMLLEPVCRPRRNVSLSSTKNVSLARGHALLLGQNALLEHNEVARGSPYLV